MTGNPALRSKNKAQWALVRYGLFQTLVLGGIWFVLVDGDMGSWPIGIPAVVLAVAVSVLTLTQAPNRWHLRGWLSFLPYFIGKSIFGAIDVARRAYQPRIDLTPTFHTYPVRLSTESARLFFADAVSLLPGTLSAELNEKHLLVHALDSSLPVQRDLMVLEEKVARLFVQPVSAAETTQ